MRWLLVAVSLVCVLILAACNCAPTLRYITISPATSTIGAGTTEQLTATGYYSNGAVTPNISASWTTSNAAVATVDGTSGLVSGVATGTATITATAIGITSSTATVTVAPIASITITPVNPTIQSTGTQQFDAVGNYSGGTTDVTAFVTWTSSNTGIATFSTSTAGLANAVAAGSTTVTATLGSVSASTTLTVTNAVSLVVTPTPATIAVGDSAALTVQEQWADMSLHPVVGTVTWSSSAPTQANVVQYGTAGGALAAGFSAGAPTITANEGGAMGMATLTVTLGTKHYGYVANVGDQNVSAYTLTPATAPYLTPNGPAYGSAGILPTFTFMNPNGQQMYVIDQNSNVWVYNIAAGVPTNSGQSPVLAGQGDSNVGVVDPYGRFVYVIDSGVPSGTTPPLPPNVNGTIYGFTINQTTGALTPIGAVTAYTTNLGGPAGIVIDPTGTYMYVSNTYTNTVSAYSIDPTTGNLTPLSTPTIATGNSPVFEAMDPTGTYLFVANDGDGTFSSYTLGTGGVLTQTVTPATSVTGAQSVLNLVVSPNGSYIYVLDAGNPVGTPPASTAGQVYGFTLASGVPSSTPITGTPLPVGVAPTGIAIDDSGSLLAVDNTNLAASPGTISLFTIGAGGALTAQPAVDAGNNPQFVNFFNLP
ncbi:MAG: Ig-like domain-containing protein [Candidatus Acidiferrum sp.]